MVQLTSGIRIEHTSHSRLGETDFTDLPFGKKFSDHMLIADYHEGKWQEPYIIPYGPVSMSLSTSALHYGQSIFEGMKAYKTVQGEAVLFRPEDNFRRLNKSAERLCMPQIPHDLFMEGLKALVRLDSDWIPTQPGASLYLRPLYFATDEFIGVRAAESYRLVILCCPVGPYYNEPVHIQVMTKYVRAFEGGTGFAKAAGNYAAGMLATREAQQAGYHNVLWMDGKTRKLAEESGTMNVFFVVDGKVLTPKLKGTILEGVTRDSCIRILQDTGITVEETDISIDFLAQAWKEGTFTEAFGTGTAATVAPIARLQYEDLNMVLPTDRVIGPLLMDKLNAIRTGISPDPYGWIVKL